MYIHDIELSASPTGSTNTLTQFCVHYSIPGTNIMPSVYMMHVRENAIAADVENDGYLYASEITITVTNSSWRRSTSRTLQTNQARRRRALIDSTHSFRKDKGITSPGYLRAGIAKGVACLLLHLVISCQRKAKCGCDAQRDPVDSKWSKSGQTVLSRQLCRL